MVQGAGSHTLRLLAICVISFAAIVVNVRTLPAIAGQAAAKPSPSYAKPPDILLLGDSQLSFGAGAAFRDFFGTFESRCAKYERFAGLSKYVAGLRFSLMGVKSTSIHTWVARRYRLKKMVCVPDPKWPVNARLYGFSFRSDGSYVQLGKEPRLPFCLPGKSPFEAMFEWTMPRLLMLYFMGNTVPRWANVKDKAVADVRRFLMQLPEGTGCVFMTTSPTYRRRDNAERLRAQRNIIAAFDDAGMKCGTVPMLTPRTIAAIEGARRYFRRRKNGTVKDPYHPNGSAARRMIKIREKALCRAVHEAISPPLHIAP